MIEVLKKDLENLRSDEAKHLAALHSTQGAIQYVEHLIYQIKEPVKESMTAQEFATMVAGEGATVGEISECKRTDTGCTTRHRESGS